MAVMWLVLCLASVVTSSSVLQATEDKDWLNTHQAQMKKGFRQTDRIEILIADACSDTYDETTIDVGQTLTLSSPGYPSTHLETRRCGWTVKTSPGNQLLLTCIDLDLPRFDKLEYTDLINGDYNVAKGSPMAFWNRFSGNEAKIGLWSRGHPQGGGGTGFSCTVSAMKPAKDCVCGSSVSSSARIMGGTSVSSTLSQPWMMTFYNLKGPYCGAALISKSWAITAGSCIRQSKMKAVVGMFDSDAAPMYPATSRIMKEVIMHPEYNYKTGEANIALVRFDPLDFSDYFDGTVAPICLPENTAETYSNANGSVTGFGKDGFGGMLASIMQQTTLTILDNDMCSQLPRYHIDGSKMCAGNPDALSDICWGDSGIPLVIEKNGISEIVGVAPRAKRCGRPMKPAVFARVTYYLDWIKDNIDSSDYCPRSPPPA